jgi:NAD(P)-dependent dehydrogenase (short-subunit alcohol dehydrogenase family)
MKNFKGQIGFITGGASGAGFGQAQLFGREGVKIVIADVRAEAIAQALAKLKAENITAHGIKLDITDRQAYAAAADEVERVYGAPPTLLFNTAGVNSFGPIENATYGDFDWLFGVNLGGVVNGMVTFVPRMIAAKQPAHIVTVASVGAFLPSNIAAPYSAAKAAVVSLMESYRMGLARHDIGVSVLCPANIRSNIAESTRLRDQRFGPTGFVDNERSIASLHSIYRHGMDPVELATHVKRGIEENQTYIIPYPEVQPQLRQHFEAIVAAVLPMEADPEGAAKRVKAMAEWIAGEAKVFMPAPGPAADRS